MGKQQSQENVECDTYCYSCGVQFPKGDSYYSCPSCGMMNCEERLSRQQYGSPDDKVWL